ncbi:TnpV protein [Coprobacillus cateniformis]|uniref:TnpV protein n=2 Tax=Erysipelotrichales TaxID=526525 RepID=UPI00399F90F6
MAIRYEDATKLYQQTLKEISKDEMSWSTFLKSACRNYRLPFADMVMIYAQRPDATAVLEIEDWNKRYGLWIKPKSKGIAVFDSSYNNYARLKYYFDISDTRQTRFYRPVPIWELKEDYEEEVINTLKDNFGPLDNENDLAQAVLSASGNVVEDNISDYLKELQYCKTDSFLEDLDEQNTEIIYKSLLTASVAYMTLSRCDINADDYISNDILRQIAQFNTRETLNALGVPTKDISQMVIGEIRKTVLSLIRDENRTIADNKKNSYNKTEKDINDERSLKIMKLDYIPMGEYQIPNLTLKNENEVQLGKYGLMRRNYLQQHRPILFTNLLTSQTLNQHLLEIEETANQRKELLMKQLMEQMEVTEELKESNQMEWIQRMNNIEETIHEMITKELIYS